MKGFTLFSDLFVFWLNVKKEKKKGNSQTFVKLGHITWRDQICVQ